MNNLNSTLEAGFLATSLGLLFISVITTFVLWSVVWKGLALWHAGRRGQIWWFVALLLINTAGILEMVYLFGVIKLKPTQLFKK